jgi:hypothetical protein
VEDWLVSPNIRLKKSIQPRLTFDQAVRYGNVTDNPKWLNVMVTNNFTGDVQTTEWKQLEWPAELPDGSNWVFQSSGIFDLSEYNGKTIVIAFRYDTDIDGVDVASAPTWEIQNLLLAEPAEEELSDEAVPADENPAVQEPDEEQKELEKRFERASQLGPEDALTADDYVFYGGTSEQYFDYSGGMAISCEDPEEKDGGENRTVSARGISLQSTKEDVERAYGPPAASGQVSDQCKFYYIMHDFEGEYDESLKKTADWHLGFDYYEYYYESGCISFDFDENGGVAAIAVDNNSRMFW